MDKVFGNRYRLVERIGIGGMAEVYQATDEVLGRTVAVKLMLPQYAQDPTFAARFKQEAQAAANLQSPYIVNIYDWGRDDADETFYIVMELVRGTDLKTAINQRGALNQRKAAEVASQVCAALAVAHGYDIIHRDIKPHNIMVQPDGNAKVMDFGIARANGSGMTQTGSVLGTAYYVSPEQAQGKELTPATDLYSLGVVLYEAVTGELPFEGPDAVSVALKQVNQQPVPPSLVNPAVDADLEAIILKAMAKDPAERYATADAMRTALNNYLSGQPLDAGATDPQAATTLMAAAPPRRREAGADASQPGDAAIASVRRRGGAPVARTQVMPAASLGQPQNELLEVSRKKNRRPAIIAAVLAALLALLGIGWLVSRMLPSGPTDTVAVPKVVGFSQFEAEQAIRQARLEVGRITQTPSDTVDKGKVISTDPREGTQLARGSRVDLVVSAGNEPPKQVSVPSLVGKLPSEAEQLAEAAGFKLSNKGEKYHDTIEAGRICQQSPEANQMAMEGSEIGYWVSKGKEESTIPSVVGKDKDEAEKVLFDAGFGFEYSAPEYSESIPKDHVISQSPTAGNTAVKDTVVRLTLSKGPKPKPTVPSVVGKDREEAERILGYSGFTVEFTSDEYNDTVASGHVIRQLPQAGSEAIEGASVRLTLSKGPAPTERITVPSIIGMTKDEATVALQNQGLRVAYTYADTSFPSEVDRVLECSPGPGEFVNRGTTVTIMVGK